MKDIELSKLLQESVEGTYLEYMGIGNPEHLKQVLRMDPEHFVTMPSDELSKAMFTLVEYVAFLTAQANVREATWIYEKKEFGIAMALAIKDHQKGTVAEREAIALSEKEDLRIMKQVMMKAHLDFIMFQKMPDSFVEKINAIKKELSRRGNGSE